MTIGQRIKVRREELNMSQEELAKRIGYKSRSSINKIELDLYSLQQSKIKANALNIPVISEQQWFELVPELEAIGMWNGKSISYSLALEDNTTIYKDPESKIEIPNIKVVSVVDEIRGLKQLLDEGILTEEEFAAKKKQLLGI